MENNENNNEVKVEESVVENKEIPSNDVSSSEQKVNVEESKTIESDEVSEPKESVAEVKEIKTETKKSDNFGFLKLLWKILKTFLLLLALAVFAVIIVQRVSNNKATVGGYGIYTIVSESMVPEYNIWDMLFAKKTDAADIQIGDDVVYQGKEGDFVDKIVTHRVIKKIRHGNSYTFVTKGIANDLEDPAIEQDQIYGKVVLKSTVLSFISKVINNEYGFYFIVFVPIVIIVSLEVIDTANERKRLKRN